jgi:SpoVK/Ycf46/Vps4 family AAA+-type ATPase
MVTSASYLSSSDTLTIQVREACTAALKEKIRAISSTDNLAVATWNKEDPLSVTSSHFERAFTRVFPSVSNTVHRLLQVSYFMFLMTSLMNTHI